MRTKVVMVCITTNTKIEYTESQIESIDHGRAWQYLDENDRKEYGLQTDESLIVINLKKDASRVYYGECWRMLIF